MCLTPGVYVYQGVCVCLYTSVYVAVCMGECDRDMETKHKSHESNKLHSNLFKYVFCVYLCVCMVGLCVERKGKSPWKHLSLMEVAALSFIKCCHGQETKAILLLSYIFAVSRQEKRKNSYTNSRFVFNLEGLT